MADYSDFLKQYYKSYVLNDERLKPDEYFNASHDQVANKADTEEDLQPAMEDDQSEVDAEEAVNPEAIKYFTGDKGQKFNQPTQIEQTSKPQTPYDRYLEILKRLQKNERSSVNNLNLVRGGNQIAQAIASGYGGKIGDGSAQLDKIQESAQQPKQDYLQLLKILKEQQAGQKSPVGFGQFTNNAGDPLVMLPDGSIWNASQKRPHDPREGIIRAAVEQYRVDPKTGAGFTFKPGITGNEGIQEQVRPEIELAPKQTAFDIKKALSPKEEEILNKDIDQFQQEVKEPNRILVELGAISDKQIDAAQTNPNSAKTLGAFVAQVMQGGRLTDADVTLYTGQSGIVNWLLGIKDYLMNGGLLRPEFAENIKKNLATYRQSLDLALKDRALNKAKTISKNYNPNLKIDNNVLAELYYIPKAVSSSGQTVKIKGPSGEVQNILKEKADKYLGRDGYEVVE